MRFSAWIDLCKSFSNNGSIDEKTKRRITQREKEFVTINIVDIGVQVFTPYEFLEADSCFDAILFIDCGRMDTRQKAFISLSRECSFRKGSLIGRCERAQLVKREFSGVTVVNIKNLSELVRQNSINLGTIPLFIGRELRKHNLALFGLVKIDWRCCSRTLDLLHERLEGVQLVTVNVNVKPTSINNLSDTYAQIPLLFGSIGASTTDTKTFENWVL
mmetsp:Transcript_11664/g.17510  ORF Transcript_11664/g.17510 Transcript_11664/m.17510 type:complete len:217 (+) Transcript_11664:179-829(+)